MTTNNLLGEFMLTISAVQQSGCMGCQERDRKRQRRRKKKKALHELPYINTVKTELKDRGSDAVKIDNYFLLLNRNYQEMACILHIVSKQ